MIGGSDCGCQLQSHVAPVAIPTSYTATDPLYLNPHEAGSWTVQLLLLQLQKKNHDSAITVSSRSRKSKASLTSKSHTSQFDQTLMTTRTPQQGSLRKDLPQRGVVWMWFGAFPGAFGLGRAQPQRRGTSP